MKYLIGISTILACIFMQNAFASTITITNRADYTCSGSNLDGTGITFHSLSNCVKGSDPSWNDAFVVVGAKYYPHNSSGIATGSSYGLDSNLLTNADRIGIKIVDWGTFLGNAQGFNGSQYYIVQIRGKYPPLDVTAAFSTVDPASVS